VYPQAPPSLSPLLLPRRLLVMVSQQGPAFRCQLALLPRAASRCRCPSRTSTCAATVSAMQVRSLRHATSAEPLFPSTHVIAPA
jgi:hypothetical protein